MICDYCENTEKVHTLSDRTQQEPDIHICEDCYWAGVEPKLSEKLA